MDLGGIPGRYRQADAEPELRAMGYRKLSARSRHHAQAEGAIENFKSFPEVVDQLARDKSIDPVAIEVWFADEAWIGQKNKITRRWAARGSRSSAPHDQRTASTYFFGTICPNDGKGAALVLPSCNIAAVNLHLAEIAMAVAPGAHAVLLLDQAGWHLSDKLLVPPNITLVPLPPKTPRTQSGRECLAIHPRQLALQPRLPLLRRHPRTLLLCLEQARRPALDHRVNRLAIGRSGSDQWDLVIRGIRTAKAILTDAANADALRAPARLVDQRVACRLSARSQWASRTPRKGLAERA
jgi:hypothetical protein